MKARAIDLEPKVARVDVHGKLSPPPDFRTRARQRSDTAAAAQSKSDTTFDILVVASE